MLLVFVEIIFLFLVNIVLICFDKFFDFNDVENVINIEYLLKVGVMYGLLNIRLRIFYKLLLILFMFLVWFIKKFDNLYVFLVCCF